MTEALLTPTSQTQPSSTPSTSDSPWGQALSTFMPEELHGDSILSQYKDRPLSDFVTQDFVNNKKAAASAVKIPGEGADEAKWREFYTKLGVPDSPDKYEFPVPENIPEGMEYKPDTELQKKIAAAAHKYGVTPAAMKALASEFISHQMNGQNNGQQQNNADEAAKVLQEVWGNNLEKELNVTEKAIQYYLPKDLAEQVIGKIKNDPVMIQAWNKVGALMGEDAIPEAGSGNTGESRVEQLRRKEQEIYKNPQYALQYGHPDYNVMKHSELKGELDNIYKELDLLSRQGIAV